MRLKLLLFVAVCAIFACKNSDSRMTKEVEDRMEKYFSDNKLGSSKTSQNGMMYVITRQGTGNMAVKGDRVTVNYRGKLLSNKEFDSTFKPESGPLTYTVGKTVPGLKETVMIPGFDEAVLLLKQGGAGTFVIPPYLGYAAKTVNNPDGSTLIEPNSTIVFDIELIEVPKAKPANK